MPGFVEIDAAVLEKNILKSVNIFSLFRNYIPLEKGVALHLKKAVASKYQRPSVVMNINETC